MTKRNRLWGRVGKWPLIAALGVLVTGIAVATWLWTRQFIPGDGCSGPRGTCLACNLHGGSVAIVVLAVVVASGLVGFGLLTPDDGPRPGDLPKL